MARKCPSCGKELIQNPTNPNLLLCKSCNKNYKAPSSSSSEGAKKTKKKGKLSILLLISFILGAAYMLYSIVYWASATGSVSGWEQVGAGIATALVMPHLICTAIAVIFNALGLFMNKRGFALTGAILYSVALVLFPVYFMFVIIEMILSYVGFAKMPKQ